MSKPVRKLVKKPARKAVPVARKPVAKREAHKSVKAKSVKHLAKPTPTKAPARPAEKTHAKPAVAVKAPATKSVARAAVVPAAAAPAKPVKGAPAAAKPVDAKTAAAPAARESRKGGKAGARAAAEKLEVRLPPSTPEDRQSQLKLLIARGKEQGFLTYAEVNDHLPSEIVDPEQIEDIVQMINDMGIPVYEKAPDAEALLMREPVVADEEAAEEAAAALATTVDAEFGRRTDPVRMYMREMGTVELLTREGEISIAKRIEEGLDSVREALSHYPPTHDLLLRTYEPVKAGQGRLVDLIVGFHDPNAPDVIAEPINPKLAAKEESDEEPEDENGESGEEEEAIETGPDPEEAARRFASLAKLHAYVVKSLDEKGSKDPKSVKSRKKLSEEFMELRLSPRMFDHLINQLREHLNEIRTIE